jgi:peroxiredoxin
MAHTPPSIPTAGRPLAIELEAKKAGFAERAPDDLKTLYDEGLQAVIDAGVVENAKSMGDQAPNFTLTNQTGEEVSLEALLEQGPVVLLWYRGGWCPYCNLTLAAYQGRLDDIRAAGATLVALTPELPDRSIGTAEKEGLDFQVLSDVGNEVAREYGVVFELTEGVQASYEKAFGLSEVNGDDSGELPLAATYVIDQSGTIRWAFLDADYRNRAEPGDVVAVLEGLSGESGGG